MVCVLPGGLPFHSGAKTAEDLRRPLCSPGVPFPVGSRHVGGWPVSLLALGLRAHWAVHRSPGARRGRLEEAAHLVLRDGPVVCVAGSPLPPPPALLPKTAYESLRPALYLSLWDALQYLDKVSAALRGARPGSPPTAVMEEEKTSSRNLEVHSSFRTR